MDAERASGAATRRRERRLRSMLRHERMAVAMALAEALHHSSGTTPSLRDTRVVEGAKNDASRGQKTVTRAREGEVREEHLAQQRQTQLPPGIRPALLVEVHPQGCVERHIVEDPSELAPLVQILDAPVPQMVDSALDFFRRLDLPVAEQVIDVPMISSSSSCPSRAALSEPLMVEQLVEVPTIISYSSLQRSVEHRVVIPVPGGGGPSYGLQGFFSGQSSTAVPSFSRIPERSVEQIVDLSSEECISERIVETSAFPSSKKRSSERILEQITVPSSEERSSQRIVEQLVDISSGGLSPGVFSASSAGAADEGPAGRGSGMGKARFAGKVAPRALSSRGKAGFAGEDAPRGSSSCGKAGSTGDDAPRVFSSRGKAGSNGDDAPRALSSRGKAVFFEHCEFFILFDGKWESQGRGIAKLIQHSSGAQFFEFWKNEQMWYDDVIHRVGADVLVLKPVGRSARAWSRMDPDFAGGPSEYRHAVRFSSPELARRFYAVWMGSG